MADTDTEVKQIERAGTILARWDEDTGFRRIKRHRLAVAGAGDEMGIVHQTIDDESDTWRTVDTWEATERPEVLPDVE